MKRYLLVDFENVPTADLAAVPAGVTVPIFLGATQRTVSADLLLFASKQAERFTLIKIEGQGKNALDFHIAFYLGRLLAAEPQAECVVLSRDKGFDVLLRHAASQGYAVRRATTVADAYPTKVSHPKISHAKAGPAKASAPKPAARKAAIKKHGTPESAPLERALALLTKLPKRNRPAKRASLLTFLKSHMTKQLEPAHIDALVEELIASGRIGETGGKLVFDL